MLQALSGFTLELLRPSVFLFSKLTRSYCSFTEREKTEAEDPGSLDYSMQVSLPS
jgi:hypothetical protein